MQDIELQRALQGGLRNIEYGTIDQSEAIMKYIAEYRIQQSYQTVRLVEDNNIHYYPWRLYQEGEDPYVITYPVTIIRRINKNGVVVVSTITIDITYSFFLGLNALNSKDTNPMRYFIGYMELFATDNVTLEGDRRYKVEIWLDTNMYICKFEHDGVYQGILTYLMNKRKQYNIQILDVKGNKYEWKESE